MKYSFSTIVKAGLLVGSLDISAALIQTYLKTGRNPTIVFNYIASGLFDATESGNEMKVAGLLIHYFIAFAFTVFFFWVYPKLKFWQGKILLTGILYGLFIWTVMNLLVVPLSKINRFPSRVDNAIIAALILICCIGIPLAIIAVNAAKENK